MGRGAPRDLSRERPEVIAIFGPSGSGKSVVAEGVARRLATEVVSADALQVYRGLEILTNQPDTPTRLVGIRDLDDEMTVGEFARLAHREIDGLVSSFGAAVVTGGTGLYLRGALVDLGIPPAPQPGARERWEHAYDTDAEAAYATLARRDPRAAARLHANDRRRVVRALELAEMGASLARADEGDRLWSRHYRRPTVTCGLDVPADELDRRIRARAEAMVQRGVIAEAVAAWASGPSRTAARALGLEELATLPADEALERLIARTRRYAAYQRKWMRRIPSIVLLDGSRPTDETVDAIFDLARAR